MKPKKAISKFDAIIKASVSGNPKPKTTLKDYFTLNRLKYSEMPKDNKDKIGKFIKELKKNKLDVQIISYNSNATKWDYSSNKENHFHEEITSNFPEDLEKSITSIWWGINTKQ